jgi:endonuclease/exonuclease/phosphatase family metal-dependent hydrolase
MLRIISYNIQYGFKIDEIYKWINSLEKKPDIICFQEFPVNEIENLKKITLFKDMGFAFVTGLSRRGIPHGELTIFDVNNLSLINSIEIDLGVDHIEKIYKRYPTKRSALVTTFQRNNKKINIINVHLSAVTLNSGRRKQIKTLIEKVDLDRTIIIGDFNYSNLFGGKSLLQMMEYYKFKLAGEGIITNKYKGKISQQLDYVFYKNLALQELEVFELNFSDHFPIMAEFDIE